jgi:hypothetical protein
MDVEDTAAVQAGFSHALLRPCSYLIEVMRWREGGMEGGRIDISIKHEVGL